MLRSYALILACAAFSIAPLHKLKALTSPWKPGNRIAVSADGNIDADPDDYGATPMSLAILAKSGLQQNLVHYDFNNWLEYKPMTPQENGMWESSIGAQARWGFDKQAFFDVSQDPPGAIKNLTNEINKSTAADPLFVIVAGPAQVIYEAMAAANGDARQHVQFVSHSGYNLYYKPRLWQKNWDDVLALNPKQTLLTIPDQNYRALKGKDDSAFNFFQKHADPNLRWVFSRIQAGPPDVSDAGMISWLLGISGPDNKTQIEELEKFFGDSPIPTKGNSDYPSAPNAKPVDFVIPQTEHIFIEKDGRLVIEAERVALTDSWVKESKESGYTGEGYLRYAIRKEDSYQRNDVHGPAGRGVLFYKIRIQSPGKYRMALKSSHKGSDGAPANKPWNQAFTLMGIDPAPFGRIRRTAHDSPPQAGFTFDTVHENYTPHFTKKEGKRSSPVYDLQAGDHCFFVAGRSGNYKLDKIHFFKEGIEGFKDDSIPETPTLSPKKQPAR